MMDYQMYLHIETSHIYKIENFNLSIKKGKKKRGKNG